MGEIHRAGGLVDHHKPDGRKGINGAYSQAADQEERQLAQITHVPA
jgi:hypothetical protein